MNTRNFSQKFLRSSQSLVEAISTSKVTTVDAPLLLFGAGTGASRRIVSTYVRYLLSNLNGWSELWCDATAACFCQCVWLRKVILMSVFISLVASSGDRMLKEWESYTVLLVFLLPISSSLTQSPSSFPAFKAASRHRLPITLPIHLSKSTTHDPPPSSILILNQLLPVLLSSPLSSPSNPAVADSTFQPLSSSLHYEYTTTHPCP